MEDQNKRKCIFTGEKSDCSLKITSSPQERHNWAKSVPCTKEYIKKRGEKPLNELEFRLVELFYEQEIARLRIAHCEAKMNEIRRLNDELSGYHNYTDDFSKRVEEGLNSLVESEKTPIKEVVTEENFSEKLIESVKEACEHAKENKELKTTYAKVEVKKEDKPAKPEEVEKTTNKMLTEMNDNDNVKKEGLWE